MKSIRLLISRTTNKMLLCDNRGSVMIAVVIAIVMASILGSYSVYLISSSSDSQVGAHFSLRAYYLAESGQNYVKHLINNACNSSSIYDPNCCQTQASNLQNITYTISNGDKFKITGATYNTGTGVFSFSSTGITNQGTSAEAARTIDYFLKLPQDLTKDPGNWTSIGGSFSSNTDGGGLVVSPSTGSTKRTLLKLNQDKVPVADGNGLLSYDVQVKCMTPASNSEYLMGISFRIKDSSGIYSYYGASFMQSNGTGSKLPNAFGPLENGHLYIVLWTTSNHTSDSAATILGYKQVLSDDADPIIGGLLTGTDLKPWSTIVVRVTDSIDDDGAHQNTISVYVQNTGNYPRGTMTWSFGGTSGFTTVTWTGGAKAGLSSIQDNTITSSQSNVELGLHMNVHDNGGDSKAYFDDFTLKSAGSGSGGDISQD